MISIAARRSAARYLAEPFPHIILENALAPDAYAALSETFPSLATVAGHRKPAANNRLYIRSAEDVVDDPAIDPLWRRFFRHHVSPGFWREILPLVQTAIVSVHPDLERRAGKRLDEMTAAMRGSCEAADSDIRLDCQFGLNSPVTESSTVRTPHVDKPNKLFNALLYFRAPEDETPGGDLEIYRCRRRPAYGADGRSVLASRIEPVATVPYRANTLVLFVNSPTSVHGVTPRPPTPHCRRYVNFLCEYREPLFDVQPLPAWLRRLEMAAHRLRDGLAATA